ncbi:cellulose binding domain-containing protein [Microbispora sp. CA-135349]|uniref:cellulose binding domain-containing protein n=1 Tax=Microbispora sp. CA-135349 TaxID=3239953 RepID=UPI003D948588
MYRVRYLRLRRHLPGRWNGSIAPGGSAAFGFLVTTTGSTNGKPAGFTLNGAVRDTA